MSIFTAIPDHLCLLICFCWNIQDALLAGIWLEKCLSDAGLKISSRVPFYTMSFYIDITGPQFRRTHVSLTGLLLGSELLVPFLGSTDCWPYAEEFCQTAGEYANRKTGLPTYPHIVSCLYSWWRMLALTLVGHLGAGMPLGESTTSLGTVCHKSFN